MTENDKARNAPSPTKKRGRSTHAHQYLLSLATTRDSIAARLLIGVLLLSSLVTLILTAVQLYADYRRDITGIQMQLSRIGGAYLDSLAEGLWTLDKKQLRLQLDGILRLPDIRGIEIREAGGKSNLPLVKLSRDPQDSTFAREYPLHYTIEGTDRVIGTLRVEATHANVYRRLAKTASTILVSQAITIFMVSLFIFYFFHQLVTRHLSAIAADVDSHRITDAPLKLRLKRRPTFQKDELQRVVTSFNTLSRNLHTAYHDLAEREAKIRRLVDANIVGVFTWQLVDRDETGDVTFLDVNDAFLRIVGYDRKDLVEGSVSQRVLTPPDWQDRTQLAMAEMKLRGAFQPYEKEYIRKDGSRVPVLIGAAQFGETAEQGVAFVLDLTEQKQAEAALRESEEQWKAVFENNPVMYFMVDEAGTILSVNPFGAEQLGYRVDELVGRPVTIVFYEPDRETVEKNAADCFARSGQAMSWELRKVRKNGEMIWVRETARASVIKNGLVLLIVCENITESKRTAEALVEVQTELAHANRVAALGQLTASIAHEVNQPIAGALSSGNAALRWLDKPDLKATRRAIERVIRDVRRAGDVISGLRALVKNAPRQTETFDINQAIHEVIIITRGEAEKNGISVETQLAQGLPPIQGDRVQVQQVVLNLAINAIEAMSEVGDEPKELVIRTAKSSEDFVLVVVRDTGPGLVPENADRAFEAFYTTKSEGLGMGLSICRSIVEAHGGKLTVTANAPHGAIFQFTVPAHPSSASGPRDTGRRGQSALLG